MPKYAFLIRAFFVSVGVLKIATGFDTLSAFFLIERIPLLVPPTTTEFIDALLTILWGIGGIYFGFFLARYWTPSKVNYLRAFIVVPVIQAALPPSDAWSILMTIPITVLLLLSINDAAKVRTESVRSEHLI